MQHNLLKKIMLICFISVSFSFSIYIKIKVDATYAYKLQFIPKINDVIDNYYVNNVNDFFYYYYPEFYPNRHFSSSRRMLYLNETLHSIPEFKSNPNDSNYFPPFLRPMYFNVFNNKDHKNYKVEGYVADLLVLISKDSMLLPKKYDYFVKLFNDNIILYEDDFHGIYFHSSMIYTIDPLENKCPEFWKFTKIGETFKKCIQTTMLPIYYIEDSLMTISGTVHNYGNFSSKIKYGKNSYSILNFFKNERGCLGGNPEVSNILNDSNVFCFGVGKSGNFSCGIAKYFVKKGRFKEGNYLYYHSVPREEDNDYRPLLKRKPDKCPQGWLTKRIPGIFMIDGEYKIDCYYKIPDPKF